MNGSSLRYRWDACRFARQRGDYYAYLAGVLHGTQGTLTLKDIFRNDAARYGQHTVRGRLSREWLQRYQRCGGDLYMTWSGCFPVDELGVLRSAQSQGNQAVLQTLQQLAHTLGLLARLNGVLVSTLGAAVAGLLLVLLVLAALPAFTVPRLLATFADVPPAYFGSLTQRLIAFSAGLQRYGPAVLVAGAAALGWVVWSLPNYTGPLRSRLDRYAVWQVYRQVHALRLLSMLVIFLGAGGRDAVQLRPALVLQRFGMSAWTVDKLHRMIRRLDAGVSGVDTFDVGLLDPSLYWLMHDWVAARGLTHGVMATVERLQQQLPVVLARKVQCVRWGVLIACVALMLGLALWHYAVIDELRRSLLMFHATRPG